MREHPYMRRAVWLIMSVGLPIVLAYGYWFGSSQHAIGMALFPAALGAILAFLTACFVASRAKERIGFGDLFRVFCWTVVGAALGVINLGGYYEYYYPAPGAVVMTGARACVLLGILGVALSVAIDWSRKQKSRG